MIEIVGQIGVLASVAMSAAGFALARRGARANDGQMAVAGGYATAACSLCTICAWSLAVTH